jgi:hypothetical protein
LLVLFRDAPFPHRAAEKYYFLREFHSQNKTMKKNHNQANIRITTVKMKEP